MIIGNRFHLNNKINSGSFGEIHLAVDIKTKQTVAVKMEQLNSKHPQLEYQAKLLAYLTDQIDPRDQGFPRLHYYGKYDKSHVMVMDLLGPSLEELFQKCNKKFTLKTVVIIGLQLIERLKYLHKKKFIHRDIKPENFLLGMHQYCAKVFMIDLGLSKKYVQKNGEHIPYRDDRSLKGTPRYTSLNSHLGIEQSRRDDLQSIIYMLIYFLKGQLPWQNLKQDNNYDRYEKILQKKLSVSVQNLCLEIPSQFKQLVEYTRNLHFIQEPNYEFMKSLLEQTLLNKGIKMNPNDLYCWEQPQGQEDQNQPENVQQLQGVKQSLNRDSIFSNNYNNKFTPFDSGFEQPDQAKIKPKYTKVDDSLDFNPFDSKKKQDGNPFEDFRKRKQSRQQIQKDPFHETKTQRSAYENDPFGNSFEDFQPKQHQVRQENIHQESFDDPFGDFKQPQIQEL